jgi:hypothetical protein
MSHRRLFRGGRAHLKIHWEMVPGPVGCSFSETAVTEYHLIDLDERKTDHLRTTIGERPDVFIYTEDSNEASQHEFSRTSA